MLAAGAAQFDTKKKYIGQEHDYETGLNYFNARYYNPQSGRFISEDPASLAQPEKFLEDPQQLNLYSYASNNPITYKDPSGLCPSCAVVAGIAMAISGAIHIVTTYINPYMSDQEKAINYAFGIMSMAPAASAGLEAATTKEVRVPDVIKGEGVNFSQKTANYKFSKEGAFAGETIGSKVAALKQGALSPEGIPINYVEREGIQIVENNRSTGTVISAGVPKSQWNLKPADRYAIDRINMHLKSNNLGPTGTNQLIITGKPAQLQDACNLNAGAQSIMLQGGYISH